MVAIEHKIDEGCIVFSINTLIYPLMVVMKTAYNYTDDYYIFLDYLNDKRIEAQLKPKEGTGHERLELVVGDFYNQLLNQNIRLDIQKKTSDLRQLILGRALYTECIEVTQNEKKETPQPSTVASEEIIANKEYKSDPCQIASPWTAEAGYKGDD